MEGTSANPQDTWACGLGGLLLFFELLFARNSIFSGAIVYIRGSFSVMGKG